MGPDAVEDIYEACFQASPTLKFGLAFCEVSRQLPPPSPPPPAGPGSLLPLRPRTSCAAGTPPHPPALRSGRMCEAPPPPTRAMPSLQASGDRKIRFDGNSQDLVELAKDNASRVGAGGCQDCHNRQGAAPGCLR